MSGLAEVDDRDIVINSNWHPISYRFGVITAYCSNFGHCGLEHSFGGLRDNVRCLSWAHWKARSELPISVDWSFSAKCYGWGATSKNRSTIGDFAPTRSVWPKISGNTDSQASKCLTTLSLTFCMQRNFVADFLQVKCDFTPKTTVLRFWAPFLGATYDDHLKLNGKRVMDFLSGLSGLSYGIKI